MTSGVNALAIGFVAAVARLNRDYLSTGKASR